MNSRVGAAFLVVTSLVYLAASLATGHSASSASPAAPAVESAGLTAWQAARLLIEAPGTLAVVDTRNPNEFALYHLPHAVSIPDASPEDIRARVTGKAHVIIVAGSDGAAAELLSKARPSGADTRWRYLVGGARDWYLTFELPVPLFSDKPPPFGYAESFATVRRALKSGAEEPGAVQAWQKLQSLDYAPTVLQGKKSAPSGGKKKKKKISGGCGG